MDLHLFLFCSEYKGSIMGEVAAENGCKCGDNCELQVRCKTQLQECTDDVLLFIEQYNKS